MVGRCSNVGRCAGSCAWGSRAAESRPALTMRKDPFRMWRCGSSQRRRRPCAGTGEHGLGGMSRVRQDEVGNCRALRLHPSKTFCLRQRRTMEEQTAVTAFFQQHVQFAAACSLVVIFALRAVLHAGRGVLHGHGRHFVVHGHRLGNQRPDEHHQHCEEADPAGAGLGRRPRRRAPGARVAHRINARARRHRPAPAPG